MSKYVEEKFDLGPYIPSSYDSENSTFASTSGTANGCNDINSTNNYARFTIATTQYYAYYDVNINTSEIPDDARNLTVSCSIDCYRGSSSRITLCAAQLFSNTTAKGSAQTISATSRTVTDFDNPGTWTKNELNNLKIRLTGQRSSGGGGGGSNAYYIYFYGARITITYEIEGLYYEITSTLSTDAVTSIKPEGYELVRDGSTYVLRIDAESINDIKVEDNAQNVTTELVAHRLPINASISAVPQSYEVSGSISSGSQYASYPVGYSAEDPHTYTSNMYASSGNTASINYSFDFSSIPEVAEINSVEVRCSGRRESTTTDSTHMAKIGLYSGTTLKSTEQEFTSTSDSVITITNPGTWTRAELQNAILKFTIAYYGGRLYGVTWVVNYSIPGQEDKFYWTYTISSVDDDHTIIVSDAVIIIPDEDPELNYYNLTISSINASTNPKKGTTRVVEGTNQTIEIYPTETQITLITDNGVDVSNRLVLHGGGEPTYTITTPASADYGFSLNQSTGYYISTNDGQNKTAAIARVNLSLPVKCLITIEYVNYAEARYDYGLFGKVDTAVATDGLTANSGSSSPSDSLDNYYYICSSADDNVNTAKTLTYEIESGEHFIDIKYGKDDATADGNDALYFKIVSITPLESNNYYTYDLTNISEDHSLIFIFGDVRYYFINSQGTECRLFPAGSLVALEGDSYKLTVVPNDYSYACTVLDNGIDVTSNVERIEMQVEKEGQLIDVVNYEYTLSNVTGTHNIVVSCFSTATLFVKINNVWNEVRQVFVKVNGTWVKQTDYSIVFSDNKSYTTKFIS